MIVYIELLKGTHLVSSVTKWGCHALSGTLPFAEFVSIVTTIRQAVYLFFLCCVYKFNTPILFGLWRSVDKLSIDTNLI